MPEPDCHNKGILFTAIIIVYQRLLAVALTYTWLDHTEAWITEHGCYFMTHVLQKEVAGSTTVYLGQYSDIWRPLIRATVNLSDVSRYVSSSSEMLHHDRFRSTENLCFERQIKKKIITIELMKRWNRFSVVSVITFQFCICSPVLMGILWIRQHQVILSDTDVWPRGCNFLWRHQRWRRLVCFVPEEWHSPDAA